MLTVDILYTDDCEDWETAAHLVDEVLGELGLEAEFQYYLVETDRQAIEWGFQGSPEIRVNGDYLFPAASAPAGKALRTYVTDEGVQGHPSVAMLREALEAYL
ncbi:MAG: thioredoxin family protein [Chloroflexi bacterium]|nr:thioredoxin family protein [Chloroflexota bacterium]